MQIRHIKSSNFICGICKQEYQLFFNQDGKLYSILDRLVDDWKSSWVFVSEAGDSDSEYLGKKLMYIIEGGNEQTEISIGRGKESDI